MKITWKIILATALVTLIVGLIIDNLFQDINYILKLLILSFAAVSPQLILLLLHIDKNVRKDRKEE